MDLQEAVRGRRSIRGFLQRPVPEETIRSLVTEAFWAPSWGNTQQYEIIIATGDALERFKKENREALASGKKQVPELPMQENWPDYLKRRYMGVGKSVLSAQAIGRDDNAGRMKYYADMFALFDAPALIVVTADRELCIEYAMLDAGLFLQTFKLLAHAAGLGTISLAASVRYPEILRKNFSIQENRRILIGTALGWPDTSAPVNNFPRTRDSFENMVRWVK